MSDPFLIDSGPTFSLTVGSNIFTGWLEVTVDKSLEEFAHSFTLKYCDQWTIDGEPWEIFPGHKCTLKWGDQVLITGYVTQTDHDITSDQYNLNASGRSQTADLVDCSAIHKTGQWKNASLAQIATDLCRPFGIEVDDRSNISRKFQRFELDDGETVHEAINRACRIRACLPITTPEGMLAIVRADTASTAMGLGSMTGMIEGLAAGSFDPNTIISRRLTHGEQDRYSKYIFKSQLSSTDEFNGSNAVAVKGEAVDASILRYRPIVMQAELSGSKKDMEERALWERNVRAARSDRLAYTVDGLTGPDGVLWEPGQQVKIQDDLLKVDDTLIVISARFLLNADGLRTDLEFTSPEAYSMDELPERDEAWNSKSGKSWTPKQVKVRK